MKKLEFKTGKGQFILEEASVKNLCRVLVKYMTEEQFAEVVDESFDCWMALGYKDYENDNAVHLFAKQSFESLINSLGWYLWENPYAKSLYEATSKSIYNTYESKMYEANIFREAESKTLYNPVLLKKL